MSNIFIDKEKFKELLVQFKGDIGYQTELLNTLLDQMPQNYIYELITDMFVRKVWKGPYYILQHEVITSQQRFFLFIPDIVEYLNKITLDKYRPDAKRIDARHIHKAIETGLPLYGYRIIQKQGGDINA